MAADHSQCMAALAAGNAVRTAHSRWKRDIHQLGFTEGSRAVADMLENPGSIEGRLGSLRVEDALLAIHRVGPSSVTVMLRGSGITVGKRHLRQLTERQRYELARRVRVNTSRAYLPKPRDGSRSEVAA